MTLHPPIHYHADLTQERLAIVAEILLEEYNKTIDDLSSITDDNYTRGCTAFGRQKNGIKQLSLSGTYPWLQILNSTNDLVFKIGSVPCRFSSDDPNNPKKGAVLTVHRYQTSFFDEMENNEPCRFCFVLDKGVDEELEPRVVFLGFDATSILKCQWESDAVRKLYNVTPSVAPNPIEIGKPTVTPKKPVSESDRKDMEL